MPVTVEQHPSEAGELEDRAVEDLRVRQGVCRYSSISTGWNGNIAAGLVPTGAEERRQKMQPLSIERDVRRNGIRMDCVFEGTAFDTAREQVRTLRLSGTKLSQIAEQTGMPVEQVMDYCRELGLPEIGSCHLVPPVE